MDVLIKAIDLPQFDYDELKNTLSYLNELIIKENKKGLKYLRTYGEYGKFGDSNLYGHITPFVESVIDELTKAGYKAEIHRDKDTRDTYLLIKW